MTRTATRSCEVAASASADRVRRGAYLNKVLALRLGDERLELGRGKSIDEASFGNDEKQHLGACQNRQFVSLEAGVSKKARTRDGDEAARQWRRGQSDDSRAQSKTFDAISCTFETE